MSDWPRDVVIVASSHGPQSNPRALYSARGPRSPEVAYDDYRSADDVDVEHQAGCRWAEPVPLVGVRVVFRDGHEPRAARLAVLRDGAWQPMGEFGPAPRLWEAPCVGPWQGVRVEQAAGGGSEAWPGVLRIESLAVKASASAPVTLELRRLGAWSEATMPLHADGDPTTHVSLSDADAVRLTARRRGPIGGLEVEVLRLGEAGSPTAARAWLAAARLTVDGAPVASVATIDAAAAGVVAGRVLAGWRLEPPVEGSEVTVTVPLERPFPLFVARAALLGGAPAAGDVVAAGAPPTPWSLPAEPGPPEFAATLGLPGTDERVGALPGGGLVVQRGGRHSRALHIAWAGDGRGPRRLSPSGQVLEHRGGRRWEAAVVAGPDGAPVLHQRVSGGGGPLTVGFSLRDGAWPARGEVNLWCDPAPDDGVVTGDERRLSWRSVDEVRLQLALRAGPTGPWVAPETAEPALLAAADGVLGIEPPTLPGPLGALLPRLLRVAAGFVGEGGRVSYGLFPSVYTGEVFGLEEDWLLVGLAGWGATDRALRSWIATTLTDQHLDGRHDLHDLRRALTPWQLERLLVLAGRSLDALTTAERAHVAGCVAWIRDARRRTEGATGEPDADGARTFAGLLPPHRFGGDVGFPTQALYLDCVASAALRSWASLTGDGALAAEAAAYRELALAALDAVATSDFQPLHSGGGEPGDYHQLMAAGLFAPVDVIDLGGELWRRLRRDLEAGGRLFRGLPRFDGWGGGACVDAQYGIGYLLGLLREPLTAGGLPAGNRRRFGEALRTAVTATLDPDVLTCREVGPLRERRRALPEGFVPGRRLSQSEPCVAGVGLLLQLLRSALVTELPGPDGRLGRRLRLFAGAPTEWRQDLELRGLPTRAGRLDVRRAAGRLHLSAPSAEAFEIVAADGSTRVVPGPRWEGPA